MSAPTLINRHGNVAKIEFFIANKKYQKNIKSRKIKKSLKELDHTKKAIS